MNFIDMITDLDIVQLNSRDYNKLPAYLYHATDAQYLDDISKYGLGAINGDYPNPFYDEGIFIAQDYQVALDYGENIEDICLLEIPTSILRKNCLFYDTNDIYTQQYLNGEVPFNSNVTLFYSNIIKNPSDRITILN